MRKILITFSVFLTSLLSSSYINATLPCTWLSKELFKKYTSENFNCSMFRSFPCACGKSVKGGSAYKYRVTLDSNYNLHCDKYNSNIITGTWQKVPEDRIHPLDNANAILRLPFMRYKSVFEEPHIMKDHYVFMVCSHECSAVKNAIQNLEKTYEKKKQEKKFNDIEEKDMLYYGKISSYKYIQASKYRVTKKITNCSICGTFLIERRQAAGNSEVGESFRVEPQGEYKKLEKHYLEYGAVVDNYPKFHTIKGDTVCRHCYLTH